MKRFLVLLITALGCAALISAVASPAPFQQRLLRVEVAHALPALDDALQRESDALNLVFLAYADNEALWLAARLALLRYGDVARTVLTEYGLDPDFQRVLVRFGADTVLPVDYFHTHEVATLSAQHWANRQYDRASGTLARWWHGADQAPAHDEAHDRAAAASDAGSEHAPLDARRRGDYAIAFLDAEGHDFLAQFVVDATGNVQWVQSERVVSGISNFLTSGIRGLESKWRQGEAIGAADAAWAGVDLLVMTSAIKALRVGKAARAGRVEAQSARAGAQGMSAQGVKEARLVPAGLRFAQLSRGAKIAAVGATAYVVVRHPSLVNALGATVAHWLALPVWAVQFALWAVILVPLLAVARWLYRLVLAPALWLLYQGLRLTPRVPRRPDAERRPSTRDR